MRHCIWFRSTRSCVFHEPMCVTVVAIRIHLLPIAATLSPGFWRHNGNVFWEMDPQSWQCWIRNVTLIARGQWVMGYVVMSVCNSPFPSSSCSSHKLLSGSKCKAVELCSSNCGTFWSISQHPLIFCVMFSLLHCNSHSQKQAFLGSEKLFSSMSHWAWIWLKKTKQLKSEWTYVCMFCSLVR